MKFEIIVDHTIKERLIKLFTPQIDDEVKRIEELLLSQKNMTGRIIGFMDDEAVILEERDIVRCYSENKKTFLRTMQQTYHTHLPLYALEERLPSTVFVRISRSELVNLDYVKRLDLSFQGTIAIELKNQDVCYLSRRQMSAFKKVLGL